MDVDDDFHDAPGEEYVEAINKLVAKERPDELPTLTNTEAIIKHNQELIDFYSEWKNRKSINLAS